MTSPVERQEELVEGVKVGEVGGWNVVFGFFGHHGNQPVTHTPVSNDSSTPY